VGVDVRGGHASLDRFPEILQTLRAGGIQIDVVFLSASDATLLRRYHHTRRRHPLARKGLPLVEAIALERDWLSVIAARADLHIDSSDLTMHGLARIVRDRIAAADGEKLSLLFQSFGFKYGAPVDADFVFDVRCLPNPHYEPGLRDRTGLEPPIIDFLEAHDDVFAMFDSIQHILTRWVPAFARDHRSYLTVAIGCTGGRHRSVYLVEKLARAWQDQGKIAGTITVSIRHRELDPLMDTE